MIGVANAAVDVKRIDVALAVKVRGWYAAVNQAAGSASNRDRRLYLTEGSGIEFNGGQHMFIDEKGDDTDSVPS